MNHSFYNFYARVHRAAYLAKRDRPPADRIKSSHAISLMVGEEFETTLSEPGDSEDNLRLACLLTWDYPQKSPKEIAAFLKDLVRASINLRSDYSLGSHSEGMVEEIKLSEERVKIFCDTFGIAHALTDEPGDAGPVILRLPCCLSNRYDGAGWTVQPGFEPV